MTDAERSAAIERSITHYSEEVGLEIVANPGLPFEYAVRATLVQAPREQWQQAYTTTHEYIWYEGTGAPVLVEVEFPVWPPEVRWDAVEL